MNASRKTATNWLSAIGYRLILGVLVSAFTVTAFAADCKVNDSDISGEYAGGCVNGLAHGKGKAKARDAYEGEFKQGNKSGRGAYIWSNGDRYEGGFLNDRMNGKGVYNFVDGSVYEGEYKDDKKNGYGIIKLYKHRPERYRVEGKLIGDFYVGQGLFENGSLILACTSSQNCKQEQAKREAQERDRVANACNGVYPGKTGTRAGPSSLSIDVNYVVRYVNKDRGTATIEATNSGQLNMNRGEMKEVSCGDL